VGERLNIGDKSEIELGKLGYARVLPSMSALTWSMELAAWARSNDVVHVQI
jgi:hypothetical protein